MSLYQHFLRRLLPPLLGLVVLAAVLFYWSLSDQMQRSMENELRALTASWSAMNDAASKDPRQYAIPKEFQDPQLYLLVDEGTGRYTTRSIVGEGDQKAVGAIRQHLDGLRGSAVWEVEGRMVAVAPHPQGGWFVADISMAPLVSKRKGLVGIIVMAATLAILVIVLTARAALKRLRDPLERLKGAALSAAAGGYTADISSEGSSEIADLVNAFNTMRAGLQENISTIRETSILRELMYGEYECSLLLQYYMLDKTLEDFRSPKLDLRAICVRSAAVPEGLLLELQGTSNGEVVVQLAEARQQGLEGIIELLTLAKATTGGISEPSAGFPSLRLQLSAAGSKVKVDTQSMPLPLIWSTSVGEFRLANSQQCDIAPGDYLFVFNRSFVDVVQQGGLIHDWFAKVMKHFSQDGLEGIVPMLRSELDFLGDTQHIDRDLYLLCIHIQSL